MNAQDVVIVSTARTALSKSFRGAFNDTEAPVLGGHVVRAVVARAGIEPGAVDDVIMGAAAQQGTQGYNIGRLCAYTAGLPDTVPGMAVDRMCASGLMSIGIAAQGILAGDLSIAVAGGVESLSLTQNAHKNTYRAQSQAVIECMPSAYIPMLETAEIVSRRYGISREVQDAYSLQSQQRTATAQAAGLFAEEIVPLAARKLLFDKEGKAGGHQDVIAERDECNRASTTLDDLAALKPVWKEGKWVQQGEFITAGNASQFSDGAAAVLLMSRAQAKQRALEPLGVYRGLAVSGCAPEEMGIGPVGNQRGVCLPSGLLPRLFAHSQRALERQWRSHRHRASVWHVGHTHGGPCLVGRPSAWCAFCGGSDVHWRRHGCGRAV